MKPTQRYSIATLCIIGLIASWLAMAELLQDLQENYPKPFFLTYVIHSSYSFFLLVWLVWRYLPCQTCQRTNYLGPFKWGDYFAVSIWLSLFAFAAAYFWYLSLPRTRLLTDFMSLEFKSSWCHILQKRIKSWLKDICAQKKLCSKFNYSTANLCLQNMVEKQWSCPWTQLCLLFVYLQCSN